MKTIVSQWGLTLTDEAGKPINPNRAKNQQLETAVNGQTNGVIFVDDFHKATATKLYKFKVWNDKFRLFYAGTQPFKHEIMKHCLLGLQRS